MTAENNNNVRAFKSTPKDPVFAALGVMRGPIVALGLAAFAATAAAERLQVSSLADLSLEQLTNDIVAATIARAAA